MRASGEMTNNLPLPASGRGTRGAAHKTRALEPWYSDTPYIVLYAKFGRASCYCNRLIQYETPQLLKSDAMVQIIV